MLRYFYIDKISLEIALRWINQDHLQATNNVPKKEISKIKKVGPRFILAYLYVVKVVLTL